MITSSPRLAALVAYSAIQSGVRCADTIRDSCSTPKVVRMSAACRIVSQSDWLPMMTPTSARTSAMRVFHHEPATGTKVEVTINADTAEHAACGVQLHMRRTVVRIAFLLALSATVPGLAQTPPTEFVPSARQGTPPIEIPYTQFDLPNGLHVILHVDRTVPIVNVNLIYNVGSAREREGRTGFAHLFEHLMFMGSAHAKYGLFDSALETVGGSNNASTNSDTTNYWITVPSNALDLALFLESDRMGYLLDAITPPTVDAQREVVKNERRERVDNQPYGKADELLGELLYPKGHPYHWPVVGYMEDLTAATYDDVVAFFRKYYVPSNASLVVAGDIDPVAARK